MNNKSQYVTAQRELMQRWNASHKPGTRVRWCYNVAGNLEHSEHTTSGKAYLLGGHTAHVALSGRPGSVPLEKVTAE